MDEFLGAVEYLFAAGSTQVVLCERGVRSFDPSRRNLLDLSIVPLLQERYSLPILVDPSHATGRRSLVAPMAKAAVASGADGVMVEVHDAPAEALSDAAQALKLHDLPRLGASLRLLAQVEGRKLGGSAEAGASPPAQEASSSRPTQAREDAFSFADPSRGPA